MKNKYLSSRERKKKRNIKNVVLLFVGIAVVLSIIVIILDKSNVNENYTYEEMLHDHNGDGIPDHGIGEH